MVGAGACGEIPSIAGTVVACSALGVTNGCIIILWLGETMGLMGRSGVLELFILDTASSRIILHVG